MGARVGRAAWLLVPQHDTSCCGDSGVGDCGGLFLVGLVCVTLVKTSLIIYGNTTACIYIFALP